MASPENGSREPNEGAFVARESFVKVAVHWGRKDFKVTWPCVFIFLSDLASRRYFPWQSFSCHGQPTNRYRESF